MTNEPRIIIDSGLSYLPAKFDSVPARAMLYAIGMQESGFRDRDQRETRDGRDVVDGPAMGLFQFERRGGVLAVLNGLNTARYARMVCMHHNVVPEPHTVWKAMESNDDLAVAFARLLLYSDPISLPKPISANEERSWSYYQRNWRPGRPNRKAWTRNWSLACSAYATEAK